MKKPQIKPLKEKVNITLDPIHRDWVKRGNHNLSAMVQMWIDQQIAEEKSNEDY